MGELIKKSKSKYIKLKKNVFQDKSLSLRAAKKFNDLCIEMICYFQNEIIGSNSENVILNNGKYWLRDNIDYLKKEFPYYSTYQIQYCLDELIDRGILITSDSIESNTDNTRYYTLSDNYIERDMDSKFYTVWDFMVFDLKLKGLQKDIYAIIYDACREGNIYTGGVSYLENWTQSTKQGVFKALKELTEKGLIERSERYENGVKYVDYYIGTLRW